MTDSNLTSTTLNTDRVTRVWPILTYRDAQAGMAFLAEAFGFEQRAAYGRGNDPTIIEHAEMLWPGGGGAVMLGTAGKDDSAFGQRAPGNDSVYVVCDDPDSVFERATAAGAEVIRDLADEDYGSRGFTVRDLEGNLWSFGTYAGEPTSEANLPERAHGAATPHGGATPHGASRGPRDTNTSVTDTFATLLADWDEAIVANDPVAIGEFAEPDWAFVGESGVVPGVQFLDSVTKGRVTHDSMSSDLHDVRVYGNVAVVTARVRNSGTFEGHPFLLDEWCTDVFIRRADRWRCALTHLTPVASRAATDSTPDRYLRLRCRARSRAEDGPVPRRPPFWAPLGKHVSLPGLRRSVRRVRR